MLVHLYLSRVRKNPIILVSLSAETTPKVEILSSLDDTK